MNRFSLILLIFSFKIVAMQDCKIVPLAAEGIFSPDDKHLVVCEEEKISVHDAVSGIVKGTLPNLPESYNSHSLPNWYRFSPKGTYLYPTYEGKIWNLAELAEHLPGMLASRQIELWNTEETVFLSAPQETEQQAHCKRPSLPNIWHVHNALDGTIIHTIDHQNRGNPTDSTISSNGSLLAFIYQRQIALNHKIIDAVIINGAERQEIPNALQVVFCPDNEHALVAIDLAQIIVFNCKTLQSIEKFVCASRNYSYRATKDPRVLDVIKNSCSIKSKGLISIIKNKLKPKEKYCITQDQNKFTCAERSTPDNAQKIQSLSANLAIIQKNKKKSNGGGIIYDIFIQKKDTDKTEETCLLKEVYKAGKNIRFAGHHAEQLIVIDPIQNLLYIFDPYICQELGKINYREFAISPHATSFIVKAKDLDEKNEKWSLCILTSAADILSRERTSYFRLLLTELRDYLRNFKTPHDSSKATNDHYSK